MKKCFCCGQHIAQEDCPKCWSGHVRVGTIEFYWNGFLARRVEVAWCAACDNVWLVGLDGDKSPICRDCRERFIHLELGVEKAEPAAAPVAA